MPNFSNVILDIDAFYNELQTFDAPDAVPLPALTGRYGPAYKTVGGDGVRP
jgi:hypothetical protein